MKKKFVLILGVIAAMFIGCLTPYEQSLKTLTGTLQQQTTLQAKLQVFDGQHQKDIITYGLSLKKVKADIAAMLQAYRLARESLDAIIKTALQQEDTAMTTLSSSTADGTPELTALISQTKSTATQVQTVIANFIKAQQALTQPGSTP